MNDEDFSYRQLVRLGDMMGDGLHHEPDGKWIEKEYKNTLKTLGIYPKRKNNSKEINEAMNKSLQNIVCQKCNGILTQTKSGSMRAKCQVCGAKFQILKRVRKRKK